MTLDADTLKFRPHTDYAPVTWRYLFHGIDIEVTVRIAHRSEGNVVRCWATVGDQRYTGIKKGEARDLIQRTLRCEYTVARQIMDGLEHVAIANAFLDAAVLDEL